MRKIEDISIYFEFRFTEKRRANIAYFNDKSIYPELLDQCRAINTRIFAVYEGGQKRPTSKYRSPKNVIQKKA